MTLSAQLGPVWARRLAFMAGGGPLKEVNTQYVQQVGVFLFNVFRVGSSSRLKTAPIKHSSTLRYLRMVLDNKPLHHDQYPFPAASDYRAVHILSGCFSSL